MKAGKILVPSLLILVFLSSAMPVLALDRLSLQYAANGQIENLNNGQWANMSLNLRGTLSLGTPSYDSSGWSEPRTEDRQWNNQAGGWDREFKGSDDLSWIPGWVNLGFVEGDHYYQAHVDWDQHEQWLDTYQSWEYRWSPVKGSMSGELVAMWNGGTAPQLFSVSLSPWKVEKTLRNGNCHMSGNSSRHEKWDIWDKTENGAHEGTWENSWQIGNSFDYYAETLQIYFNGKFTTKNQRLEGRLDFKEDRYWMNPVIPLDNPTGIGLSGNGSFGSYRIGIPGL